MLPFGENQTRNQGSEKVILKSSLAFLLLMLEIYTVHGTGVTLTISPITWLSLRSVRLTPRIPNTRKTMAPVSTRGRTAGWPHAPPLHGLKPNVLDGFALAADEGSLKIEAEKTLSTAFIYTAQKYLYN